MSYRQGQTGVCHGHQQFGDCMGMSRKHLRMTTFQNGEGPQIEIKLLKCNTLNPPADHLQTAAPTAGVQLDLGWLYNTDILSCSVARW